MLRKWFNIDEKVRFALMASFNMALRFLIFALLIWIYSDRHYQILLAITWFVSSFIAFGCYKFLVFSAEGNHWHQYLKSILIWIMSYICNLFLLTWLTEKLGWNIYAAQAIVITFLLITNYLLFKHFAFKHKEQTLLARLYDIFD